MEALPFIKGILSVPALRVFLSDNFDADSDAKMEPAIKKYEKLYESNNLKEHSEKDKADLIQCLRLIARKIGTKTRETNRAVKEHFRVTELKNSLNSKIDKMVSNNYFKHKKAVELEHKYVDVVINSVAHIKETGDMFCWLTDIEKERAFFLMTVYPPLREFNKPYEILKFLIELSIKLDNLPQLILEICRGQTLEILLIGSLLSLKPKVYNTWNGVKEGILLKITESDKDAPNNFRRVIFKYCYDDLPDFLKPCFLYLACYPIDYEISARSLTEIWIAENFVTKENEETIEDTANNYLEELVQRSLVWVSKRSHIGTIKYCRVHHPIHQFAIQQSEKEELLVANPDLENMKLANRVAIHHDEKKQYTEVAENPNLRSFLAFKFDRNVYNGCSKNLYVLELRKSAIPEIDLPDMSCLRYLGLRGSIIPELPENIGDMENLQTLDVRDTSIEFLPESLWNISRLRHVHANPNPQIKGPPSTAKISNLQILKTIAVPQSWHENVPLFLINLRKLALLNTDNLAWKSISKLLDKMVNLLSMAIIGDNLPSEIVDIRAFPNLETVKSIEIEGKWICKKLLIDNVKFPSNLRKLTLTNSDLTEDPMPTLEKLKTLKILSLQNGVYKGKKMVCSENGFPQLRILKISNLKNLELWEVKPMAMSQLTKLHVEQCRKLKNLPDLKNVADVVIKDCNVEQSLS